MAGGSLFIWSPFLFSFVFQASDSRHVNSQVIHYEGGPGNPEVHDILHKIPIILPEGIDPNNINVTSIVIKTCTGVKEQLAHLNSQLQQTTRRNSQLNKDAFGLREDVRLLQRQLATCISTDSAVTSYKPSTVNCVFNPWTAHQTQLLDKINQLLGTLDSDTFLIMEVIALTREVNSLQRNVKHATNGTETHHIKGLQEKTIELSLKTQQMERNHINAALILQIISLQNLIWDLDLAESTRGDLQEQLDRKISELRGKGDANSAVLELISVNGKIAGMQRLIDVHIEESRSHSADYQRQLRQKDELLKKTISQLNCDNSNRELPKEIMILQTEVEHFRQLMMNNKNTTDSQVKELRIILEKKQQENLQKHLEEAKYSQAQLIIKIMAKAQAEIHELQRKLRLKSKECSSLEERNGELKAELEQKLAELNRTGDSKAALVLNVINLHEDLTTLNDRISTTADPDLISELKRQRETKEDELNSKTAEIERLIPNPKTILIIIELQNEIWHLEKNETTGGRVEELQSRVDGLISELVVDNTTLMLKIMTLQSQVERLQRQLSDLQTLQTTQVTQLTNNLTTKKNELQRYVSNLNEKNEKNAKLILTTNDLQNQLRKLEKERHTESQITFATVTKLREQLKATVEERSRDRAEINTLQNQLNQTEARCSSFESKIIDVQTELDDKMKEMQSNSESSLALQLSTLNLQLVELKRRLQNTESETKIKEIQAIIDEKNNELTKKTAELKARSAQPQRIIQIIAIHTEIEKWISVGTNETFYNKIRALEDHSNHLIDGIKGNENTKQMFKILAQQDLLARLKIQEKSQTQAALERIKDLEDELERVRNLIKEKTLLLDSREPRIANLSAQIMDLNKTIKPLEDKILDIKETSAENIRELQDRLDLTQRQLQDSELLLKEADAKNFNSIMDIADLRTQLKKAQKKASEAAGKNIDELEQLQTQHRANKRLENTNKDLKQEVKELKTCCTNNANTQCDDLKRQLQQSQEDADRLQQQLREKDATLKQLQQELEDQTRENNRRQHEYSNLEQQLQQIQVNANYLQQQLKEKDAALDQLQKELEEQTGKNNKLQDDYDSLQNTKNQLEDRVQDLQNKPSELEDKTIYSSRMIWDPNTAHPRIALSAEHTEISTYVEIQDVLDNPGRFDVNVAILGTVGFSSGRHYWEVSVADNCYHLGMASESSQRKGSILFRPKTGFWTIILNKQSQYMALDSSNVPLLVQMQPLKLGILLDYEKGQISFYDAGRRSHMYSFASQRFTDKIYPFINICVKDVDSQNPIVSLSPGSADWIQ